MHYPGIQLACYADSCGARAFPEEGAIPSSGRYRRSQSSSQNASPARPSRSLVESSRPDSMTKVTVTRGEQWELKGNSRCSRRYY